MKALIRYCFHPLFRRLEAGEEPYHYRPLNRAILLIVGGLFCVLALAVLFVAGGADGLGGFLPVVVFGGAGVICLAVGGAGSDRAVARIWGSKH